jgi:hypothetical protein
VLGGNVQIYPLPMQQVGDSRDTFRGEFRAARTGELFLFVNDAMLPFTTPIWGFDYRYFYERAGDAAQPGNRGTACVTVESDDGARGAGAQAGLDCAGAGASGGQ